MTIADERAAQRRECNDTIRIERDGSITPVAHVWPSPIGLVHGESCECGEWAVDATDGRLRAIVKTVPVRR